MWSGLPRLQDTGPMGCGSGRSIRGIFHGILQQCQLCLITGGYITDVLSPETFMEVYRFSSPLST